MTFEHLGKIVNDQTIIVTQKDDGSVNMINEKEGFNVDFYKSGKSILDVNFMEVNVPHTSLIPETLGSGYSDFSGARISLYDSEYGTPWIDLEDSYSGCVGANYGEFTASVSSYQTYLSWSGNQFYFHWCINGHEFDRGQATHEGNTHYFNTRAGTHNFNHSGGTGTYSVDLSLTYGSW